MELIDPIVFVSEVIAAEEQFSEIGTLIRKYQGDEAAELFRQTYKSNDAQNAMDMLDQLVMTISGCDNTTNALFQFVEKFPELNPELFSAVAAEIFEHHKVSVIDRYYDQMKQIMGGG